jgi:hypothetical protein
LRLQRWDRVLESFDGNYALLGRDSLGIMLHRLEPDLGFRMSQWR